MPLEGETSDRSYAGFSDDLDLFLDLDLSSLASSWEDFVEDLARIRTEFSWAPEVVFCSSQLRILENFAKEHVRLYRRAETSRKNGVTPRGPTSSVACGNCKKELPNFLPFRGNAKAQLEQFRAIRACLRASKSCSEYPMVELKGWVPAGLS